MKDCLESRLWKAVLSDDKVKQFNIYNVSSGIVSKMHDDFDYAREEFDIGETLFEKGVHVPKMLDLLPSPSRVKDKIGLECWFILMERIRGHDLIDLRGQEFTDAARKYIVEIEKVLDLGLYPADSSRCRNFMYDPKKRKTYLIDFEFWREATKKEIKGIRNYLRSISGNLSVLRRDSWVNWV